MSATTPEPDEREGGEALASLTSLLKNHVLIPTAYFNRLCELAYGVKTPPPTGLPPGWEKVPPETPMGDPSVTIQGLPKEWQPRGLAARRGSNRPMGTE
jgi:hypothetical protein